MEHLEILWVGDALSPFRPLNGAFCPKAIFGSGLRGRPLKAKRETNFFFIRHLS